ncbi:hypothetical protein D3880_10560 [Pseudomonas cavernae]|uniref:Uncharacterized protein n=1 Tax=Pseudomonas cavernae TaxID=2320867 RepID=A0A385Z216_9PSED|nr:hypothetical protein D3880_10560 [Pseudomonas cavernae]
MAALSLFADGERVHGPIDAARDLGLLLLRLAVLLAASQVAKDGYDGLADLEHFIGRQGRPACVLGSQRFDPSLIASSLAGFQRVIGLEAVEFLALERCIRSLSVRLILGGPLPVVAARARVGDGNAGGLGNAVQTAGGGA